MRRLWLVVSCLLFAAVAQAGTRSYYWSATGENTAMVSTVPTNVTMIAACNFDVSNPKVVMAFNSATAVSTGAAPIAILPLPAAATAQVPTCGSFHLPLDGIELTQGLEVGCSTTGPTFTADTASKCFFEVAR